MSETEATTPAVEAPAPKVNPVLGDIDRIRKAIPDAILRVEEDAVREQYWLYLKPKALVPVLKLLRDDRNSDYPYLADLTCVDRPYEERRFTMIYNLYSLSRKQRLFLKVQLAENETVATASDVFVSADWAEREVYDLFGVRFDGHPDLRRIELPDDWDGHPLRKDYPIVGKRPVILLNDVRDAL